MTTWDDDDLLMQALTEAVAGSVTETDRTAARAAFAWRTIDEELMGLAHDSALTEEVLVRGAGDGPRVLGFEADDLTLEVEVDEGILVGQVVPGRACRIAVRGRDTVAEADTDASGVFTVPLPDDRPLRITVDDGTRVRSTGWLTL
ncbi:hypothetical protein E8D34_10560 [Nocardioides sp. GY 10113]|uniref:hypothetical protein n=1 Tax=Nocardioides sp. GY 10113 TaxID=2569761 RepID=UPI0010A759A0|nr:hypothetical protein [Nocardioides sp. GY 10113]TIC87546.1 hypothetical protein E8D34_10560 [Nocardioides sp. GY 10113]